MMFPYKVVLVLMLAVLVGCTPLTRHRRAVELPKGRPVVTPMTLTEKDLLALPKPEGPIYAAVYAFRDLTGQYKAAPDSLYSTQITQGAASILVESLLESHWFLPVEREGLQDLLTERRIIRAESEGQSKSAPVNLAPLLAAHVIFEGGIIGYESNVRTGGSGANYFGYGASEQYTSDQVTLTLRAVNTRTGQVLASVTTTKTIYSQAVDSSVFRYVEFKHLLQVETGYTTNEPIQLCVREALQSALIHLIVNGVEAHLWNLRNPKDVNNPTFQYYVKNMDNR